MSSPRARFVNGTALCVLLLGGTSRAQAFCRTTTVDRGRDTCFEPCETEGYPLARPEPSIDYLLSERPFPGFTQPALQSVFETAFAQWTSVSCEEGPVELELNAAGTTSLGVRDPSDNYEANVLGYLSDDEWRQLDYDRNAFALTRVRYDPNTGELLGADIWFNGGIGTFGVCPDQGCDGSDDTVDLANVATHEAGHFLGLAHTRARGATMACSAGSEEVDKRDLSADDGAGICAIYPPGVAFRSAYLRGAWSRRGSSGGCSVQPAGGSGGAPLLLALSGLGLWRRRRAASAVRNEPRAR